MGVITTATITEGKTFGPIAANLTITDPTLLIGHMTADSRPDVHTVKINIHDYAAGPRLAEWIPYVQAARDEREQNLEAYVQNGQLFYRVIRTIQAHRELVVWYSEDLASILGVPQLNEVHYNDNGTYCCPYCAQNFRYSNSLRAHLRFKCDTLRKAMHMDAPSLQPPSSFGTPFSMFRINGMNPSTNSNLSPNGSVTSTTSSTESTSPSRYNHSPTTGSDSDDRPRKRTHSESDSDSAVDNQRSTSPQTKRRSSGEDQETRSAFRKVERPGVELGHSSVTATNSPPFSQESTSKPSSKSLDMDTNKAMMMPPNMGLMGGRYPLTMANPSFMSQLSMTRMHNENIPRTLAEQSRKQGDNDMSMSKLMDIRNMENNNMYNKMNMFPDRRFGVYPQLFKSNNPMVDKILHTQQSIPTSLSSFSLAQNWCAKCNTTFRMTSDLVYHMRSHHKREFDPLKKKREDKLRCDVCGETFRERHHLSRHMTSHA